MCAPDTPFTPAQHADVFSGFAAAIALLRDRASPSAPTALAILDAVAATKCAVLALDLDDGAATATALADAAFEAAAGGPAAGGDTVADAAADVIATLLTEADDLPEPLVDALLTRLLPPARDAAPGAAALARATLRRCEARVQPALQRVLVGAVDAAAGGVDGGTSAIPALSSRAAELIGEVHRACAQALLPVLPSLVAELTADAEPRRAAATRLLAALLADKGARLAGGAAGGAHLAALLRRARDRVPALRAAVLATVPALLDAAVDGAAVASILDAAVGRLIDPDDRVRAAAARAVADGATRGLHLTTAPALRAVGDRLRDAKPAVARAAAGALLALFRSHVADKRGGADVSSREELVLWIPARLLAAVAASADLRAHAYDVLFKCGGGEGGVITSLLPPSLSSAAAARQWAAIWMAADPSERVALATLLRARGVAASAAREAAAARADRAARARRRRRRGRRFRALRPRGGPRWRPPLPTRPAPAQASPPCWTPATTGWPKRWPPWPRAARARPTRPRPRPT